MRLIDRSSRGNIGEHRLQFFARRKLGNNGDGFPCHPEIGAPWIEGEHL